MVRSFLSYKNIFQGHDAMIFVPHEDDESMWRGLPSAASDRKDSVFSAFLRQMGIEAFWQKQEFVKRRRP